MSHLKGETFDAVNVQFLISSRTFRNNLKQNQANHFGGNSANQRKNKYNFVRRS
jgi:hypothetical protein